MIIMDYSHGFAIKLGILMKHFMFYKTDQQVLL